MSEVTYTISVSKWNENDEQIELVDRYLTAEQVIDLMVFCNNEIPEAIEEEADEEVEEEVEQEVEPERPEPKQKKGGRRASYDKEAVLQDIKDGISPKEISETHGVSIGTVYQLKSKNKLETSKTNSRGLPTVTARKEDEASVFNPETRDKIKDLREQSLTTSEIATKLNLDPEDVAKVMARTPGDPRESKNSEPTPQVATYRPRKVEKTVDEKIEDMVKEGLSLSELYMAFPSVESWKIQEIKERFDN